MGPRLSAQSFCGDKHQQKLMSALGNQALLKTRDPDTKSPSPSCCLQRFSNIALITGIGDREGNISGGCQLGSG